MATLMGYARFCCSNDIKIVVMCFFIHIPCGVVLETFIIEIYAALHFVIENVFCHLEWKEVTLVIFLFLTSRLLASKR